MEASLARLRRGLDAVLVGQRTAKTGLLLAILAREHAYLEGPPGSGKSALAVALPRLSGARETVLRFHRDVREHELLGDSVLAREALSDGERISRRNAESRFEGAEVAVLDDLSRAPGEALAPLLRVLEERRLGGVSLPLECAVATALPPALEAYVDPLEPTQLDRFAVQVRVDGLLQHRDWTQARRALGFEPVSLAAVLTSEERHDLQRQSRAVEVPDRLRRQWLDLMERVDAYARREGYGALSDRAFSRGGMNLLRAHALVRGAVRADERDLAAARYMLARRAPGLEDAHLAALIEQVTAPPAETESGEEGAGEHRVVIEQGEGGEPVEGEPSASPGDAGDLADGTPQRLERPTARAEVTPLLRALEGRLDRGGVEVEADPGGVPRRVRRLDRFDEILDADSVETLLLAEGRLAEMPRALRRERYNRGGVIAVLRDVSASMDGRYAQWAGEVVAGIVRAGARRRMRVGYLEFNHQATAHRVAGDFLHRRYGTLLEVSAHALAKGRTNYEAALSTVLDEFRTSRGRNRHVVLLTDGVPVLGDPLVVRERLEAARLGVKIHTVFIGKGEAPRVLDHISAETGGLRFQASPQRDGRIALEQRDAA